MICQIVNTIPTQLVAETTKAHKDLSHTFSPKTVAAMLYYQVSKTESLNSICDVARELLLPHQGPDVRSRLVLHQVYDERLLPTGE